VDLRTRENISVYGICFKDSNGYCLLLVQYLFHFHLFPYDTKK